MANSAFDHTPSITVPGSSTNTALVRWSGTGGKTFLDSTILVGATTMGLAADTNLLTFSSGTLTIDGTLAATTVTGNHTSGAWTGTAVITTYGGTGLASYTAGDMFYYASGTTLTKLAKGTADQVLTMNDGATAPQWETAASASAFPYSSATVASIEATTSTTNDRIPSMYVTANGSGIDMADGFGPQIIFRATDSGATNSILGQMSFERNGADNSGKFRIQSYRAGAANTLMIIDKDGEMQGRENDSYPSITKGIAKAWCQVAYNGVLTGEDLNVNTTGQTTTGVYTVTLTTNMEATTYVCWAAMREGVTHVCTTESWAVGGYTIKGWTNSGSAVNVDVSTGIFGEAT